MKRPQISNKFDKLFTRHFQIILLWSTGRILVKIQNGSWWYHLGAWNQLSLVAFFGSNLCFYLDFFCRFAFQAFFFFFFFSDISFLALYLSYFMVRESLQTQNMLGKVKNGNLATWVLGSGSQCSQRSFILNIELTP